MTRSKAASVTGAVLVLLVAVVFAWPGNAQAGAIERASLANDGSQAIAVSQEPSISADGRYVVFSSAASNLVAGDANGLPDIFMRDMQSGITTLVSVSSDEVQLDAGGAWAPCISADGNFVVFVSMAHNLTAGDGSGYDVYLRDLVNGTTVLVSVADDETVANGDCEDPVVSADGRYVAFQSAATNLVGAGVDTNGVEDVFLRDVIGGTTTRVSVSSGGVQANAWSLLPSISADGRYVAFQSDAANLVDGDTNGRGDIFLRDVTGGTTARVSVTDGEAEASDESLVCDISADGTHVAFESYAPNLVVPTGAGSGRDIYVRDLAAGTTTWVSVSLTGTPPDGHSVHPTISSDGRYVAFMSYAENLVPADDNWSKDVFVRDLQEGTTRRLSVSASGAEAQGESDQGAISADGSAVAFYSNAGNLVLGDTNNRADIFVAQNATTTGYSGIRGIHRYQTAQLISQAMFIEKLPPGSGVVVAPGETFPEALCGAPLAAAWGGPVLLTPGIGLENGTRAELIRLDPAVVYCIGLSDTIANAIRTALPSATVNVIRGAGGSVYDMSYQVAKALGTKVEDMTGATAILTVGTNFPDAIGVSPLACAELWPILLTPGPTAAVPNPPLHAKAAQALSELGITHALKVGTYVSLPGTVSGVGNSSGADRYFTNANVANWAKANAGLSFTHTAFATGDKFPDALASGPYLAKDGGILLLSPLTGPVPAPIGAVLTANKTVVQHVTYIACIEPVVGQVKGLLGGAVNLIFIHHSVGANWLNNGLTTALNASLYHVADTSYGWTGGSATDYGSHTDTGDWPGWFNNTVMPLVYAEMDTMTTTNNAPAAPGGNSVIMFKSCYPNSEVGSDITDEKAIYNSLLPYFQAHPDKMFVLIVPSPMQVISNPAKTRELSNWLTDRNTGWLKDLTTGNVFAFDFYNVLTDPGAHHRLVGGVETHTVVPGANTLYYDSSGDDHPNATGSNKAAAEFVPLLNKWYREFSAGL